MGRHAWQPLASIRPNCYNRFARFLKTLLSAMKPDIHPTYYPEAKIVCASCNTVMITGSTQPEMRVEICSNCHPFYTGKQNLIDTAGRVDRFKRIVSRRESIRAKRSNAKLKKKTEA